MIFQSLKPWMRKVAKICWPNWPPPWLARPHGELRPWYSVRSLVVPAQQLSKMNKKSAIRQENPRSSAQATAG